MCRGDVVGVASPDNVIVVSASPVIVLVTDGVAATALDTID